VTLGLILTVIFLLGYLIKRRKTRLRNAAISFATAALSFSLLITAEGLFFSYNSEDKKEVLVASREAPIGGILLKLYKDGTFEIGGFRKVQTTGRYEIKSDTLFITAAKSPNQTESFTQTTFIIKEAHLEEVENTGIGFLNIHVKKLK